MYQLKPFAYCVIALCVVSAFPLHADSAKLVGRVGTLPAQMMAAKITVTDLRRSYEFYTHVLGLQPVQDPIVPQANVDEINQTGGQVIVNATGSLAEAHLCLVRVKGTAPDPQQTQLTTLVVKVVDVRKALERARAAGFRIEKPPVETMGMVFGFLQDPDGYGVELAQAQSFPALIEPAQR